MVMVKHSAVAECFFDRNLEETVLNAGISFEEMEYDATLKVDTER